MLTDPCADSGIFAWVVQARLPENSSDNVFLSFFVLNFYSFNSGLSMVYFKENYNFTRFRGGGGGGAGGSNLLQGGGRGRGLGVQMLILETHKNFLFSRRGSGPSIPPLDPHM